MARFYVEYDNPMYIINDKERKIPEIFFDNKSEAEDICQLLNLLNPYKNKDNSFSLIYKRELEPISVNGTPMDEFVITLKDIHEIEKIEINTKEKYNLASYIGQHRDDIDSIMDVLNANEKLAFLLKNYQFLISNKSIIIIGLPNHYVKNEIKDSIEEDFPSTKVFFEHMIQKRNDEDYYILKIIY